MSNIRDNKVIEKEIKRRETLNRLLEEELTSSFVLRSFLVYEKERQNEFRETN